MKRTVFIAMLFVAMLPGWLVIGCGHKPNSVPPVPPPPTVTTTDDEVWADGKQLTDSVDIAPNTKVKIGTGAHITAAPQVIITVQGTLEGGGGQASISGTSWTGIVVARGGTLNLDGVDLSGAQTALSVQPGAQATFADAAITSPHLPFTIGESGTLTLNNVQVTGPSVSSVVEGSLTASHLDYDSNGAQGITLQSDTATLAMTDSNLHGPGPVADMIVTSGAADVQVSYTDIETVHCAFHFNAIHSFAIDHVNMHNNAYGFMLYGSDSTGTRSITHCDIDNSSVGIAEAGTNGPITVSDGYWAGNTYNDQLTDSQIAVSNMSDQTPVPDAGPRS
jgi:hypothetical protein